MLPSVPSCDQPESSDDASAALRSSATRRRSCLSCAAERGFSVAPPSSSLATQDLGVDELVAGRYERRRRLLLAEAVDDETGFADARGEPREIAVARNDAETAEPAGVEQIHRVDDQRRIGRVLAGRVAELLDRLDRVRQQRFLPALELRAGPVAVDALDRRGAVLGDLGEQAVDDGGLRVVGVDENGERGGTCGHGVRHVGLGNRSVLLRASIPPSGAMIPPAMRPRFEPSNWFANAPQPRRLSAGALPGRGVSRLQIALIAAMSAGLTR